MKICSPFISAYHKCTFIIISCTKFDMFAIVDSLLRFLFSSILFNFIICFCVHVLTTEWFRCQARIIELKISKSQLKSISVAYVLGWLSDKQTEEGVHIQKCPRNLNNMNRFLCADERNKEWRHKITILSKIMAFIGPKYTWGTQRFIAFAYHHFYLTFRVNKMRKKERIRILTKNGSDESVSYSNGMNIFSHISLFIFFYQTFQRSVDKNKNEKKVISHEAPRFMMCTIDHINCGWMNKSTRAHMRGRLHFKTDIFPYFFFFIYLFDEFYSLLYHSLSLRWKPTRLQWILSHGFRSQHFFSYTRMLGCRTFVSVLRLKVVDIVFDINSTCFVSLRIVFMSKPMSMFSFFRHIFL